MKRYRDNTDVRVSALSPMSFLDLRQQPASVSLRPGQTIEAAWAATGAYLKKALSRYGTTSRTPRPR